MAKGGKIARNKFGGQCADCGGRVEAGKGWLVEKVDSRWRIRCANCQRRIGRSRPRLGRAPQSRDGAKDATARMSRDRRPGCLEILGLSPPCTTEDVKAAYRHLARQTHPDLGGDAGAFQALNEAYRQALSLIGGSA